MKYCTYQIGPTTIFPRPFIIARKSSPHFLFWKDSANKEDVGFKFELVNQSREQSSNDLHLLIFYFNEEQCIWICCWCDLQSYSLSRLYSLHSACGDVFKSFTRTCQKKRSYRNKFLESCQLYLLFGFTNKYTLRTLFSLFHLCNILYQFSSKNYNFYRCVSLDTLRILLFDPESKLILGTPVFLGKLANFIFELSIKEIWYY